MPFHCFLKTYNFPLNTALWCWGGRSLVWSEHDSQCHFVILKGKFPQTTMWIGWVESNFSNPTVKFWANLDNPFKRSNYSKVCMSPSLDGTMPESVISQLNNSPLTLYIEFHNFYFFLDINSPVDQFNHKCMHIHLSPNVPKYKK